MEILWIVLGLGLCIIVPLALSIIIKLAYKEGYSAGECRGYNISQDDD